MQYHKLTPSQRNIKRWRARRNHLVAELLAKDKMLMRAEALRIANKMMRAPSPPVSSQERTP